MITRQRHDEVFQSRAPKLRRNYAKRRRANRKTNYPRTDNSSAAGNGFRNDWTRSRNCSGKLRAAVSKIFEGFGVALVILIGLELLKVLKLFLVEDKIKPEIIVEIAVIALCNKIITIDTKHTSGDVLLGIAAILIGLSVGYYVFRFRTSNKETFQNRSPQKNQTVRIDTKSEGEQRIYV